VEGRLFGNSRAKVEKVVFAQEECLKAIALLLQIPYLPFDPAHVFCGNGFSGNPEPVASPRLRLRNAPPSRPHVQSSGKADCYRRERHRLSLG
jgi:hypothetical protein